MHTSVLHIAWPILSSNFIFSPCVESGFVKSDQLDSCRALATLLQKQILNFTYICQHTYDYACVFFWFVSLSPDAHGQHFHKFLFDFYASLSSTTDETTEFIRIDNYSGATLNPLIPFDNVHMYHHAVKHAIVCTDA